MAEKEKVVRTRVRIINVRCAAGSNPDPDQLLRDKLGLPADAIGSIEILRRATDARQARVDFVYTLEAEISTGSAQLAKVLQLQDVSLAKEPQGADAACVTGGLQRPIIIGAGPAGLFAARTLLDRGARPIIIERGERIAHRVCAVEAFWSRGSLNSESNVLYGEGGAGTFSDGKLTTRIKSSLKREVLKALAEYGAPSEILYLSKPHVGTDLLRKIIPCMVDDLKCRGADFIFNTALRDIQIDQGQVRAVTAGSERHKTRHLFLAAGHSARDVYMLLHAKGVRLEAKGFAVGLRIEHPQELINARQFGLRGTSLAPCPADYFLTFSDQQSRRGVYTFCMCPGGVVIGCASASGQLCTNGMSAHQRDSGWSNAAVVVTVLKEDFCGAHQLAGVEFQERLENRAFQLGGGCYHAPAQRAVDFVSGKASQASGPSIVCTYRPGITEANLSGLLPESIHGALCRALRAFDRRMPGFVSEGVLVGVETRSSSPVRIVRDAGSFQALGVRGLIPIGEGSGYAGGIMSSAVDGMRAALSFDAC